MPYYSVSAVVYASTIVYVEASSIEEAYEKAQHFEGMSLNICHQCANAIGDPAIGEMSGIDSVYECNDDAHAIEWIEENS